MGLWVSGLVSLWHGSRFVGLCWVGEFGSLSIWVCEAVGLRILGLLVCRSVDL